MRKFLIGVAVSVVAVLATYKFVPKFEHWVDYTYNDIRTHFYNKSVSFKGLNLANEESLRNLLPLDASVVTWLIDRDAVLEKLRQHPIVKEAKISNCSFKEWNCFKITITEKVPTALVALRESTWAVDQDGVFLAPIKKELPNLPMIKGVDLKLASPDYVKGRTLYALKALEVIEKNSTKQVESISVRPNGEFKVKFLGTDFQAIFIGNGDFDFTELEDESLRLKALLEHVKEKVVFIEKIDLAYDSQAVVKLTAEGQKQLKDSKFLDKKN